MKPTPEYGSFADPRDGRTYKTVKIGEQTWFAENLNYEAEGSKVYGNDPANAEKYGRLYDWEAAKRAVPPGWHLPTSEEWDELVRFADGGTGAESPYDSKTAGRHLKAETLAAQGHPYIAFALVILQIAIIPFVLFSFKWYSAKATAIAEDKKKIVDLERQVTAQRRDAQYKELKTEIKENKESMDAKIKEVVMSGQHRDEEISMKLATLEKMMERMFAKMDKIEARMHEVRQ